MNTIRCLIFFLLVFLVPAVAQDSTLPAKGMIPDEQTAVKVAEVLLVPVFGDAEVAKYFPYHAVQRNGIWQVYGTLKAGSRGGTPMIEIRKRDAKVSKVWHSQ